jgi:predicted transport protein
MSDLKVFRVRGDDAVEIRGVLPADGSVHRVILSNAEAMLGIRLLARDYGTGSRHGGRVPAIGLDENDAPVVVEVERSPGDGVIARGVFFLDWLLDHRADARLLATERLGAPQAAAIDWRAPRLICLAPGFTRYDLHLAGQMARAVDLVRYTELDGDLVALEHLSPGSVDDGAHAAGTPERTRGGAHGHAAYRTVTEDLAAAPEALREAYAVLSAFVEALGEDVTRRVRDTYIAYRRLRNFTCVEVDLREGALLLYLRLDPDTIELEDGFTRDVTRLGHFGTGYLEVRVTDQASLDRALPLVRASYLVG